MNSREETTSSKTMAVFLQLSVNRQNFFVIYKKMYRFMPLSVLIENNSISYIKSKKWSRMFCTQSGQCFLLAKTTDVHRIKDKVKYIVCMVVQFRLFKMLLDGKTNRTYPFGSEYTNHIAHYWLPYTWIFLRGAIFCEILRLSLHRKKFNRKK